MNSIKEQSSAHGGKRHGAGRPKGARDRATVEQKATLEELARSHTDAALATIVGIMEDGENDGVRLSAANSLLDRGYGKPRQSVDAAVGIGVGGAGMRERARELLVEAFGVGSAISSGGGG